MPDVLSLISSSPVVRTIGKQLGLPQPATLRRGRALPPGDVVLAISHSGRTKDVLDAVKLAKESGAAVVAISRFGRSPLQRLADVTLHTLSSETAYRSEAIASRIAQLAIIDVLFVGAFLRNHPVTSRNLSRSRSAIMSKQV